MYWERRQQRARLLSAAVLWRVWGEAATGEPELENFAGFARQGIAVKDRAVDRAVLALVLWHRPARLPAPGSCRLFPSEGSVTRPRCFVITY